MNLTALSALQQRLEEKFSDKKISLVSALGELTLTCLSIDSKSIAMQLRDDEDLFFEQCIDICGIDYHSYPHPLSNHRRFATIAHLLSLKHNFRLRLRVFAEDNRSPILPSLIDVWNSVNWFEREIFDLYGIIFEGHPDLRRILTDYGFIGHPFRKDFPISGYVEMHYDTEQKKVVYRPVSIEPREVTPLIIREESYGG
jgi:NADH-quinone oxidoreductase subunit C